MRFASSFIVFVLAAGCAAQAQNAPSPAATQHAAAGAIDANSSVDQILDALDARGESLKDFTANITQNESNAAIGTDTTRRGKVWFQKLPGDDARMRLTLDNKESNGQQVEEKLEYVYQKGWLEDRDYRKQLSIRRQVVKPGEKINLLKLGQGPFPLPLGQKKEDVYKLFEVAKVAPDKNDPVSSVHLKLTPKPNTRYSQKFDALEFWIDTKDLMPVRIKTTIGDQEITRDLSDIRINTGLSDQDFTLAKVDEKGWQIRDEEYQE
jgi:outer membrane lipoprotein-sorting protein